MNYKDNIDRLLVFTRDPGFHFNGGSPIERKIGLDDCIILHKYGEGTDFSVWDLQSLFDLCLWDDPNHPKNPGHWVFEGEIADKGGWTELKGNWRRPDEAEWSAIQDGENPWPRTLCYI